MFKWLLITTLMVLSLTTAFGARYCGVVPSISYETDIFENIRMGVKKSRNNDPSLPVYLTVKDSRAIEKVIGVISKRPYYSHENDMDDFSWAFERSADVRFNPYFVCVEGSDFRKGRRGGIFMDKVSKLRIWENKELAGTFEFE